MKAIGWPLIKTYGNYLAPDGNVVRIAYNNIVLVHEESNRRFTDKTAAAMGAPLGTLFVVWDHGQFHKDRDKMIVDAQESGKWIVRDLPMPE